jgi:anaphase-promoting complex subunit 5
MSRYLTPAKVSLLALIDLYTDGAVPNDGIVPVLSFITSHILDGGSPCMTSKSSDRWEKVESTVSLMITIRDFEKVLNPILSSIGLPGRRLWDKFLDKIWCIDSLHALHEFFDGRLALLERPKDLRQSDSLEQARQDQCPIARNSPLGMFLRQSYLEFAKLPFHQASELWTSFVQYRQPTEKQWKRRPRKFGRLSFDNVLVHGEGEWGASVNDIAIVPYADVLLADQGTNEPVSTDEIESLLEFQIRQMQRELFLMRQRLSWIPRVVLMALQNLATAYHQ